MLRLVGFVGTDRDDAARFGHPEHGVPQLRIGRSHLGRHDRVQVSAAHRGQVATRQAGVAGEVGDPGHETVGHGGLFRFEQVECVAGVGGVGTDQRGPGEQGGQYRERDPADPEERGIAEQLVMRGQSADLVEDPSDVRAATHACAQPLWGRSVEPEVYTIASGSEESTSSCIASSSASSAKSAGS